MVRMMMLFEYLILILVKYVEFYLIQKPTNTLTMTMILET